MQQKSELFNQLISVYLVTSVSNQGRSQPPSHPKLALRANSVRGSRRWHEFGVPIVYLLPGPVQDVVAVNVLIRLFEIFDAMCSSRYVRMHANRHHARRLRGFRIESIERINAPLEQCIGLVMMRYHYGDVVDLSAIRDRENRAIGGFNPDRLVVQNPIAEPG